MGTVQERVHRSTTCTALLPSKTYYMKTNAIGLLKDVAGNNMAALNTKASWRWTTTLDESKVPEVSYLGGFRASSQTTVTGYIYFAEQIQGNAGSFSVTDCGADFDCVGTTDNSA